VPDSPAGGREAEIEAVARAWWTDDESRFAHGERGEGRRYTPRPWSAADQYDRVDYIYRAEKIIAALDAVRSGSTARNREDRCTCEPGTTEFGCVVHDPLLAARSPQSEDHDEAPRWTIYKRTGVWDDVIEGPDTGEEHDGGIEVVPARSPQSEDQDD